jgi:hypothetical protein
LDLNYLLYREQAELLMARQSTCPEARSVHLQLCAEYGLRARAESAGEKPRRAYYRWPRPRAAALI